MTADPTILVLGVGGNVSQGILKSLAMSSLNCRVVGACTSPRAMGLFTVDKAYVSPLARDEQFLEWLIDVCRREEVHGVLSGVEPVLEVLSRQAVEIQRRSGARVLVSTPQVLAVGSDKLASAIWMRERGFDAPHSVPADDLAAVRKLAADCGYPLIAKPRRGRGSAGILPVRGEADLLEASRRSGYLVQESIGEPEQEYTAATLSDRDGRLRGCMVLHRELRAGTTYRAEAGEFPAVRRETLGIAEALAPTGPCNLQFRLRGERPVCFEINVRFSGTAPIRTRFGFNDVEAAVRHFVMGEEMAELPTVTEGVALRYWNELYAEPEDVASLEGKSVLEEPRGWAEDYATPE